MQVRLLFTLLYSVLCLSVPSALAQPRSLDADIIADASTLELKVKKEPLDISAQWIAAISFLIAAAALAAGIHQYRGRQRWRRVEFARRVVEEFKHKEAIKKVLGILDFEEYRDWPLNLPNSDQTIMFEATDSRLRRSLRKHGKMVKIKRGIDVVNQLKDPQKIDHKTLKLFEKYELEEFPIEVALRDWFDEFLHGLEYFESLIESKLVRAEEIKPFIIYWIQLIGDRSYRRDEGSSFYDQLFLYINRSRYSGVESLFERYGYKILPPPYEAYDFENFDQVDKCEVYRTLCLAKAAYVVYEDKEYVRDIVKYWLTEEFEEDYQTLSDEIFFREVVKDWLRESGKKIDLNIDEHFNYIENKKTDTQSFVFRKKNLIVLVFRGSQQLKDWQTNFNLQLIPFKLQVSQATASPAGKVHRGFFEAWASVELDVVEQLQQWRTPDTKLFVTGHSLGGALAALAAVSLQAQGLHVDGLYTFGQPRVGDWEFVNKLNSGLRYRSFRFVNNNDAVPLIPPPFTLWNLTRLYGHFGQLRYFNAFGKLMMTSTLWQRLPDRFLGLLKALSKSGLDVITDHYMEFYIANLQCARALEQENNQLKAEKLRLNEASADN